MTRAVRIATFAAALSVVTLGYETSACAKGCSEVSDIVGYERCNRFGNGWALERRIPIVLGLEFPYQSFDPDGTDFQFQHGKNDPNAFTVPGQRLGSNLLGTMGFNVRVEGYFWAWLYIGSEFGLGFGHDTVTDFTAIVGNASRELSASNSAVNTVLMHVGAFAGIRIPLGRMSLRGEAFAGVNVLSLSMQNDYSGSAMRGILGPRALVDFWASPTLTFSAYAGLNLVDTREQTFGLVLQYHVRSFDGAFW